MNIEEVKEQMQEDLLSFIDGWGIGEALGSDYIRFLNGMCDIVITNLNKIQTENETSN